MERTLRSYELITWHTCFVWIAPILTTNILPLFLPPKYPTPSPDPCVFLVSSLVPTKISPTLFPPLRCSPRTGSLSPPGKNESRNPEQMFEQWKLGFPIGSMPPSASSAGAVPTPPPAASSPSKSLPSLLFFLSFFLSVFLYWFCIY